MASKCCERCAHTLPFSLFLIDPSSPESKSLSGCATCRAADAARKKRKALTLLDPNVPSKRPAITRTKPAEAPPISPPHLRSKTRPESSISPLPPPESRPEADVFSALIG
jgi:hypothetical protein